jgi:dienelactone hydrolase
MQDDLTWGVKHLVAKGVADPKHVGIMGGSYGGYATLAGVAFTPDLYAAAVSIVGPSNLITLLESFPPYWEAGRKIFYARMGDPTTPEGKAQLTRQSPLNSADKIKTPLLVVQGANDPRVKKAESDQIVVALRERGFPVEYLVAPDEGHGFARPVNNMAMFAAAEKFLAHHLGARFQEGAQAEVATRLSEITVDVATVTLPVKVEAASLAVPKPTSDLVAGTSTYKARIEMAGQSMALTIRREIVDDGAEWKITDAVESPMISAQDVAFVSKGSLELKRRKIQQGPITIDVAYAADKATGTMTMNGEPKPIEVGLEGAIFADGPGGFESLGALPLVEGYTASYRNVDLQRQKARMHKMTVAGAESVSVPAGAFDAWRLEIEPLDGDADKVTVWVDRGSRRVVKTTAIIPQLGGAQLTAELLN